MRISRVAKRIAALLIVLVGGRAAAGPRTAADRAAEADNRFGFKLLSVLAHRNPTENIFISPFSIASALGMAYEGAGGATRLEMARCLELDPKALAWKDHGNGDLLISMQHLNSGVEVLVANSLWGDKRIRFRPEFLHNATLYDQAEVTRLNFEDGAAVPRINHWVLEKTHGKIEGIVDQLSPQAVLVLVNAIYFNARWEHEFDSKNTRPRPFHFLNGSTKPCPMMSGFGIYPYLEGQGFRAVGLPYDDTRLSFSVFLPDSSSSLVNLVDRLGKGGWSDWTRRLERREGEVVLPRFNLIQDLKLGEVLHSLGMQQAFRGDADFSGIADVRPLFISEVRHKTRIEVSEQGTEAAAATAVMAEQSEAVASSGPPFRIVVDRPFVCAISDRITGLVLFLGAITEPKPL